MDRIGSIYVCKNDPYKTPILERYFIDDIYYDIRIQTFPSVYELSCLSKTVY